MEHEAKGIVQWFKNHKSRIVSGSLFGLGIGILFGFGYLLLFNFFLGVTLGFGPAMLLGIGSGIGLSVGYTYLAIHLARKP